MRSSNRNGVVLFIVTIVIALVALSAYGFVVLMQGEYRAAQLRGDTIQTEAITDSAIEYSMSLIGLPRYHRDSLGIQANEQAFRNVMVDRTGFRNRNGQFSIVSFGRTETLQSFVRFGFANESAKLPLAAVLKWDEQSPGAGRQALMQIPRMTESTADAILDWIDEDSEVREFGAEDLFYMSLNPPREPANRLPTFIHELLNVRGVTRGLLFGVDVNRNGRIEEHERPHVHQEHTQYSSESRASVDRSANPTPRETDTFGIDESNLHLGWHEFMTVASKEKNVNRFGQPRINVNAEDVSTLHRQLESSFGLEVANFIVAYRQFGPYDGAATTLSDSDVPRPATIAAEFEVSQKLALLTSQVAIGEEEAAEVFESPLKKRDTELGDFFDAITLSDEKIATGRINVLLAPREVLTAIPGLSTEAVNGIIDARSSLHPGEPKPSHPYWLVEEGVVDVNELQQIEDFMTHGGDVFKAQIVAYYDEESPWDRGELMVDGSGETPQKVYYTSLNHLGRGFLAEEILVPVDDEFPSEIDDRNSPPTAPTEYSNEPF